MYLDFFQLQERPFRTTTTIDRYFPADSIEAARITLDRCIRRSEGVGLVIGTPGTGKSMLCQSLEKDLADLFQVVMIRGGRIASPRALLQSILFGLDRPYRGLDENELRLDLQQLLEFDELGGRSLVLIIDDSQGLKMSVLDELRAILNLGESSPHAVQLVLAGTSLLEEHLGSPKLQSLNQRVVARCYLEPLERDETFAFILGQLKIREDAPSLYHIQLFADDACAAVHTATGGVPRLINQLCDHAMLFAFTSETGQVDRSIVEQAWADLMQLPMPASSSVASCEPEANRGEAVVEFGSLDDGPEPIGPPAQVLEISSELPETTFEVEGPSECFEEDQPVDVLADKSTIEAEMRTEVEPEAESQSSEIARPVFQFNNPFEEVFEEEVTVSGDQYFNQFDDSNAISDETPIVVDHQEDETPDESVYSFGELTDEFDPQSDPMNESGATILDCLADQSGVTFGQYNESTESVDTHLVLPTLDELDPLESEIVDDHEIDPTIERQLARQTSDESLQLNVVSVDADDEPQAGHVEQVKQVDRSEPVIVVEEDYDEGDILPVSPFFVVRQQQFDQLFSRLRKTS